MVTISRGTYGVVCGDRLNKHHWATRSECAAQAQIGECRIGEHYLVLRIPIDFGYCILEARTVEDDLTPTPARAALGIRRAYVVRVRGIGNQLLTS